MPVQDLGKKYLRNVCMTVELFHERQLPLAGVSVGLCSRSVCGECVCVCVCVCVVLVALWPPGLFFLFHLANLSFDFLHSFIDNLRQNLLVG